MDYQWTGYFGLDDIGNVLRLTLASNCCSGGSLAKGACLSGERFERFGVSLFIAKLA
jgi:hypothetical protein